MNELIDRYIRYVSSVRRYSARTQEGYRDVLSQFEAYTLERSGGDTDLAQFLVPSVLRSYEVYLLEDRGLGARSVNLHLSVLSGFCRFLMVEGVLKSNPVRLVIRPKMEKRLPEFYRNESMDEYFAATEHSASRDGIDLLRTFGDGAAGSRTATEMYERRLRRLIVSLLHGTGIRRAELISLNVASVDFSRAVLKVRGKGDKTRDVPLVPALVSEIRLYMEAVEAYFGRPRAAEDPLLMTASARRLYPVYVDRAVKRELGGVPDITGRKSPHVLRHTIATELLNEGSDLNSIKEMLGHSSLAATQIYTHNSIEKLKKVYDKAHPRAKEK